jgi:hypothetical protein
VKTKTFLRSAFMAGLLVVPGLGCGKPAGSQQPHSLDEAVTQLRAALLKSNPQVQSNLYNGVVSQVRYGKYMDMLMALDTIANDPSLTEPQKRAVTNTIEQVKPLLAKAPGQ